MQKKIFHQLDLVEPAGLVIFDRDGTLIENIKGLKNVSDIEWKVGMLSFLKKLTDHKYVIAVATNQGAVEEGLVTLAEVEAIHNRIVLDIHEAGSQIWAIAYCPHSKNLSGLSCACRKPSPGLLDELVSSFGNQKLPTYFIGDSDSDRLAALNSSYHINYFDVEKLYDDSSAATDWFFR